MQQGQKELDLLLETSMDWLGAVVNRNLVVEHENSAKEALAEAVNSRKASASCPASPARWEVDLLPCRSVLLALGCWRRFVGGARSAVCSELLKGPAVAFPDASSRIGPVTHRPIVGITSDASPLLDSAPACGRSLRSAPAPSLCLPGRNPS